MSKLDESAICALFLIELQGCFLSRKLATRHLKSLDMYEVHEAGFSTPTTNVSRPLCPHGLNKSQRLFWGCHNLIKGLLEITRASLLGCCDSFDAKLGGFISQMSSVIMCQSSALLKAEGHVRVAAFPQISIKFPLFV